jgi:hypothetical protein
MLEELKRKVIPRDEGSLPEFLTATGPPSKGKDSTRLDYRFEKLLDSINENPCLNLSQREKLLGWYSDKMQRIKKTLLTLKLIEEVTLSEGEGRPSKHLILTDAGYQYLGSWMGEKPQPLHGGLPHHCFILKLKERYEADYDVKMDKKVDEFWPDLWCEGKDKGVVEVICTAHLNEDLRKTERLARMVDWMHIYFENRNTLNHYRYQFEKELPKEVFSKLKFSLLS